MIVLCVSCLLLCSNVHEMDCLREETVPVPGRSGAQSSVAFIATVHDGEWGECRGVSPEVHDHLHCFERVELQAVKDCTRQPAL